MHLEISPLGERLVKVSIVGRLDTAGVDRVETRLVAALVPPGNNAIIDLSQVEFVGSMGIQCSYQPRKSQDETGQISGVRRIGDG